MKTFNKRGDQGETSLLFGARVPKSDLRCEAYGTIDEAVSALGLARNWVTPTVKPILLSISEELFTVGAEIATPSDERQRLEQRFSVVTPSMVKRLEKLIDEFEAQLDMPKAFIIPGGCVGSASLDVARTIVRRAERRAVELKQARLLVNYEVLRYLNRLADLIFTLARYEDKVCLVGGPVGDVPTTGAGHGTDSNVSFGKGGKG